MDGQTDRWTDKGIPEYPPLCEWEYKNDEVQQLGKNLGSTHSPPPPTNVPDQTEGFREKTSVAGTGSIYKI